LQSSPSNRRKGTLPQGRKEQDTHPFRFLIDKEAEGTQAKPTRFKENDTVGYAANLTLPKAVCPIYKADWGLLLTAKYGDSWFEFRRIYYATLGPRRQTPMPKEEAVSLCPLNLSPNYFFLSNRAVPVSFH
jgi:hypothetical protein